MLRTVFSSTGSTIILLVIFRGKTFIPFFDNGFSFFKHHHFIGITTQIKLSDFPYLFLKQIVRFGNLF